MFIIGSKSKSNYVKNDGDQFEFYAGNSKKGLLEDIRALINTCNSAIDCKPKSYLISGNLDEKFIQYLDKLDEEELEHWRLFFIAFLHNNNNNNGKGRSFKSFKHYSPFTSLTYGKHKGKIARKFATHKISHGIVYIVAVRKSDRNYLKAVEMTDTIMNYGVNWYKDTNSELMLLNGIFPHDILRIMEVRKKKTPLLVINPWLFQEYLDGKTFNPDDGISINQKKF